MDNINNASSDELNLTIASVNPRYLKSESASKLLNGDWFIQSIGIAAEILEITVICSWAVLQEIRGYWDTKERLTVEYLDFVKSGHIINQPNSELFAKGNANDRMYSVAFELAVIPDV